MILTLVPNPSLDKITFVPGFAAGKAFHSRQDQWFPGGKGFHFARALRTLGGQPHLICPLGGEIGRLVMRLAAEEGLPCRAVQVPVQTRTGLVIVDPDRNRITELYEPGPEFTQEVWEPVENAVIAGLGSSQMLAVCGSFPPGAPEDSLARLVRAANEHACAAVLDTYGPNLTLALAEQPAVVKINQAEAGELLGDNLSTPEQALAAAIKIQSLGARAVVITLGRKGAVGRDQDGHAFHWAPSRVHSIFPVGSGDSFLAGLVFSLNGGDTLSEAARLGVAAGSANSLTYGPGVFAKEAALRLLDGVRKM